MEEEQMDWGIYYRIFLSLLKEGTEALVVARELEPAFLGEFRILQKALNTPQTRSVAIRLMVRLIEHSVTFGEPVGEAGAHSAQSYVSQSLAWRAVTTSTAPPADRVSVERVDVEYLRSLLTAETREALVEEILNELN